MKRRLTQLVTSILANSYLTGFFRGHIYRGPLKALCVPFLNCYSCPGAWGTCPMGAFQALAAGFSQTLSFYIMGLLTTLGALGGRLVCGWLCPFGFFQELLYAYRSKKWRLPRWLKILPPFVLALTLALPFLWRSGVGMGQPYFCRFICPAGTLEAGLTLLILRPQLRTLVGPTFLIKVAILVMLILLGVFIWRPFCQTLCPLGAFYGLFNNKSFWRLKVKESRCIKCQACSRSCPAGLVPFIEANASGCVRCLQCTKVCPTGALTFGCAVDYAPFRTETGG